jgi:hypothetical protein
MKGSGQIGMRFQGVWMRLPELVLETSESFTIQYFGLRMLTLFIESDGKICLALGRFVVVWAQDEVALFVHVAVTVLSLVQLALEMKRNANIAPCRNDEKIIGTVSLKPAFQ